MNTTTFDPAQHPRGLAGRFTEKTAADPGGDLLTVDDYVDSDTLADARDDLGPDATDDEVLEVAYQRAQVMFDEHHPAVYVPPPLSGAAWERILLDRDATDLPRTVLDRPKVTGLRPRDEAVLYGFPAGHSYPFEKPQLLHGVIESVTEPDGLYRMVTLRFTDGRTATVKACAEVARLVPAPDRFKQAKRARQAD